MVSAAEQAVATILTKLRGRENNGNFLYRCAMALISRHTGRNNWLLMPLRYNATIRITSDSNGAMTIEYIRPPCTIPACPNPIFATAENVLCDS